MTRLLWMASMGKRLMTAKRLGVATLAALGVYSFGDSSMSYVSTAGRIMSENVSESIPVSFEIERARTMIDRLMPDIKRNMVVIAQEEIGIESLRKEAAAADQALAAQQKQLLELRKQADSNASSIRIGSRAASSADIDREMDRRLTRCKLLEATVSAKQDLLATREDSLSSARAKLEAMLNAKRDLEIQVEDLETRLRTVETQSVVRQVNFDDSDLGRCQTLVNDLRARLSTAERIIVTEGHYDELSSSASTSAGTIREEIDSYFAASVK